jgi:hypothetical protein
MKPAQEHTVVGVRFATDSIRFDVVDFAPASGNLATRNQATTIAERDRPAQLRGEATLG